MKISYDEIQVVFEQVLKKIAETAPEGVEVDFDHYRLISSESMTGFDDPEIDMCSMYDDMEELRKLATNSDRYCAFVDFDRLAALLRAISDKFNPV